MCNGQSYENRISQGFHVEAVVSVIFLYFCFLLYPELQHLNPGPSTGVLRCRFLPAGGCPPGGGTADGHFGNAPGGSEGGRTPGAASRLHTVLPAAFAASGTPAL